MISLNRYRTRYRNIKIEIHPQIDEQNSFNSADTFGERREFCSDSLFKSSHTFERLSWLRKKIWLVILNHPWTYVVLTQWIYESDWKHEHLTILALLSHFSRQVVLREFNYISNLLMKWKCYIFLMNRWTNVGVN